MSSRASAAPVATPPVGPRQSVHIRVTYTGKGPPGPNLRSRCETLGHKLVEAEAGQIQRSTSGEGSVDIYVMTRNTPSTVTKAWEILNGLGLSSRSTVKVA